MVNGRHFEKKPLNRHDSATVEGIATKFGIMNYFNPLKPTHDENFDFLHSKLADGRRLEKSNNRYRPISATV